jgi:hydrogenase nickel incorporation protein HypB
MKIAVMEAAQETDMDAHLIEPTGAEVIELHMDESCHMDATMAKQGIEGFRMDDMDLIILENAGDFACPAEFDIGSSINAMIISVPEGDDKPLKCPLMFSDCDVVLINKIDVLPCFDFNLERCKENIWMRNPNAKVIPISALTEEGISEWTDWLMQEVELW